MSKYGCCPRYWRGCFSCPEFMRTEIFFCRKANRVRYGVEVVPLEEVRKVRAEMRCTKRTGVCWWRNVQNEAGGRACTEKER